MVIYSDTQKFVQNIDQHLLESIVNSQKNSVFHEGFDPKSVLVRPIRPDPVTAITRDQHVAELPAWNQDTTE